MFIPSACGRQVSTPDTPSEPGWRWLPLVPVCRNNERPFPVIPHHPIVLAQALIQVGVLLQPNSDPYLFSQTSYTLLPGITFKGGHVDTTGVFTCPDGANFVSGNFAANLEAQAGFSQRSGASQPPVDVIRLLDCRLDCEKASLPAPG